MKSESFQVSSDSVVGMSIVPVKVNVERQDKKVLTYAFLDSGSNTSFCTEDLLKKLNAKGKRATLSLTTVGKSNETIECSLINLEVSDIGNQNLANRATDGVISTQSPGLKGSYWHPRGR